MAALHPVDQDLCRPIAHFARRDLDRGQRIHAVALRAVEDRRGHLPVLDRRARRQSRRPRRGCGRPRRVRGGDDPETDDGHAEAFRILQEEAELQEIVRLVGIDALSYKDRLTLECARSIREDYLHQNAFHEVDTYTSPKKQYLMLKSILLNYDKSLEALEQDASFNKLITLPVREKIGRLKYVPENETQAAYDEIIADLNKQIGDLTEGGQQDA